MRMVTLAPLLPVTTKSSESMTRPKDLFSHVSDLSGRLSVIVQMAGGSFGCSIFILAPVPGRSLFNTDISVIDAVHWFHCPKSIKTLKISPGRALITDDFSTK